MEILLDILKYLGLIAGILLTLVVIFAIIGGTICAIMEQRAKKKFLKQMLPNALEKLNELAKEDLEKEKKTTKNKKTTKPRKKDSE